MGWYYNSLLFFPCKLLLTTKQLYSSISHRKKLLLLVNQTSVLTTYIATYCNRIKVFVNWEMDRFFSCTCGKKSWWLQLNLLYLLIEVSARQSYFVDSFFILKGSLCRCKRRGKGIFLLILSFTMCTSTLSSNSPSCAYLGTIPILRQQKVLRGWGQKNGNFCWRSVLFMLTYTLFLAALCLISMIFQIWQNSI